MANVFVNEESLSDIADAIRSKLNVQTTYKPGEMAAAIESISGGGITPTGTKSITANGTYDVTSYASAEVNVPTGSTPVINPLSVTENGTYTAPSGVDGYSPIAVNVPSGGSGGVQKATGTFTGSGNATQNINCSFVPDIIKIYRSDVSNMTAVADRCLATFYIAKDGAYTATYTNANATSLSNAGHGIKEAAPAWTSDYNISSTLYATYSNGVLTVGSGNGQRYSSSLTYNYELIKYTS